MDILSLLSPLLLLLLLPSPSLSLSLSPNVTVKSLLFKPHTMYMDMYTTIFIYRQHHTFRFSILCVCHAYVPCQSIPLYPCVPFCSIAVQCNVSQTMKTVYLSLL